VSIDYADDMYIDETALDVEWLHHEEKAMEYVKNAAYLRKKERQAAEVVKTTRSDLINDVNEDPKGTIGKDKPIAADIEAYYRRHPDYKEAKQDWIDAAYEAEYAEMAKNEFCFGRRKALENLVELHRQQYFAGPRVPRDISEERKKEKETIGKMAGKAKGMKRNK
jgi:hypothetical protein